MQAAVLLATIENHTATFDAMVARSKLVVSDPPKREELLAEYDKNDALTEKLNEKRVDLAKLAEADKVIERSRAQLISLGERYPIFSGISSGLFGLGLCLWYQRTQKHLDRKDRQGDGCSSPARRQSETPPANKDSQLTLRLSASADVKLRKCLVPI